MKLKRALVVAAQFLLVFTVLAGPLLVSAQSGQGQSIAFTNPLKIDSIEDLIQEIVGLASRLGAIAAVFFFIYAGFLYVTAQGDEAKVEKAHATFKWTAIGTAILLGATTLATLIQNTANSLSR